MAKRKEPSFWSSSSGGRSASGGSWGVQNRGQKKGGGCARVAAPVAATITLAVVAWVHNIKHSRGNANDQE